MHLVGWQLFQFLSGNPLNSEYRTLSFSAHLYMELPRQPRPAAGLARGCHLQSLGTGDVLQAGEAGE